jgi:hypothetical protein
MGQRVYINSKLKNKIKRNYYIVIYIWSEAKWSIYDQVEKIVIINNLYLYL